MWFCYVSYCYPSETLQFCGVMESSGYCLDITTILLFIIWLAYAYFRCNLVVFNYLINKINHLYLYRCFF